MNKFMKCARFAALALVTTGFMATASMGMSSLADAFFDKLDAKLSIRVDRANPAVVKFAKDFNQMRGFSETCEDYIVDAQVSKKFKPQSHAFLNYLATSLSVVIPDKELEAVAKLLDVPVSARSFHADVEKGLSSGLLETKDAHHNVRAEYFKDLMDQTKSGLNFKDNVTTQRTVGQTIALNRNINALLELAKGKGADVKKLGAITSILYDAEKDDGHGVKTPGEFAPFKDLFAGAKMGPITISFLNALADPAFDITKVAGYADAKLEATKP